MSRRIIPASEISEFTFCQRAWWYGRQGEPSLEPGRLRRGQAWHQAQARRVLAAGCLRLTGYALLVGAAVLAAARLTVDLLR